MDSWTQAALGCALMAVGVWMVISILVDTIVQAMLSAFGVKKVLELLQLHSKEDDE